MKKRFSQHLLVDKNHLKKIINAINITPDDIVLEIGAGSGLLTCELAKVAKKVIAVENEKLILKQLTENIKGFQNTEIIEADFLKLDLCKTYNSILNPSAGGGPASGGQSSILKVVGNIPYNITSKILIKLFGEIDKPALHLGFLSEIYLMLQFEVAERVVSKVSTKAYSPLTLLIQYFTEPKILYKVPAGAFFPVPKVNSAFVFFKVKNKLQKLENPALLKNIIRTCFEQRRKKIINPLSKFYKDKAFIKEKFEEINLDCNLRAEDLGMNEYMLIADSLANCKR